MRIEVLSSTDQLQAVRKSWDRFAAGRPLASYDWLVTWWHHYIQGNHRDAMQCDLFVLAVYGQSDELLAIAPWYKQRHSLRGTAIRCLGDGAVCTDYNSILTSPETVSAVTEALARWLVMDNHWSSMFLESIPAEERSYRALFDHLSTLGVPVRSRKAASTWRISLPECWDEYLSRLSRNHRKRCRRQYRQYIESGDVISHLVQSDEQLDTGLSILRRLHGERREWLGDRGVFNEQRFFDLHAEIAKRLLQTNQLRLTWLEYQSEPIAVEYQLIGDDTLFAYQSGMSPQYQDLSPGCLAMLVSLKWAIENGKHTFDFLRGDEDYKARWLAAPCPTVTATVWPATWHGRIGHGLHAMRDSASKWRP